MYLWKWNYKFCLLKLKTENKWFYDIVKDSFYVENNEVDIEELLENIVAARSSALATDLSQNSSVS